jgi:hypothetical protein
MSRTKVGYVSRKVWGPGDTYLVVGETQVFEEDGFQAGDKVRLTIEKMTPKDILEYDISLGCAHIVDTHTIEKSLSDEEIESYDKECEFCGCGFLPVDGCFVRDENGMLMHYECSARLRFEQEQKAEEIVNKIVTEG